MRPCALEGPPAQQPPLLDISPLAQGLVPSSLGRLREPRFQLEKWYLDLVTPDGSAWIGYSAKLAWGALRVGFASVLESPATGPSTDQFTVRHPIEPTELSDRVTWSNPALDVESEWTGGSAIESRLLATPDGALDWRALAPRAQAQVRSGGRTLVGSGYVERLCLTIAPWHLPFDILQWGRFTGASHSVVWIVWSGQNARASVWFDGTLIPNARVTSAGVLSLGSELGLTWRHSRDLRSGSVGEFIGARMPAVAKKLVGRLDRLREHKMVSAAHLIRAGSVIDQGWVIHEVVRW